MALDLAAMTAERMGRTKDCLSVETKAQQKVPPKDDLMVSNSVEEMADEMARMLGC